jgi:hypothetical protein
VQGQGQGRFNVASLHAGARARSLTTRRRPTNHRFNQRSQTAPTLCPGRRHEARDAPGADVHGVGRRDAVERRRGPCPQQHNRLAAVRCRARRLRRDRPWTSSAR